MDWTDSPVTRGGFAFQSLAVVLAKLRWPELIACERHNDRGLDAHAPAAASADGIGKGLACSTTGTLDKVKKDANKVKTNYPDVSTLVFYTSEKITQSEKAKWADAICNELGYELIVASREEIIASLQLPDNAQLCRTDGALRPDITCNPALPRGQQTVEKFFKTECFVAPEALVSGDVRFGTAGRSTVIGPGLIGQDLSTRKVTAITEKVETEFRAEFFNAFNHPNFGVPVRDLGDGNFGRVTSTADPRIIQFGLKVLF